MSRKILFRRNGTAGVLPEADQLTVGEITLNYAADEEQLATLNSEGEVATFSSDTIHNAYHRNAELVIASALNDLEERKADKEDTYTKDEVDALIEGIEVDDEISSTSENPVQNKVIYQTIADSERVIVAGINDLNDRKLNKTEAAATYLSKAEANELLETKQDVLTFDEVPTENSDNPVTSGGLYTVITDNEYTTASALNDLEDRKADKEDTYTKDEVDALIEGIEVDDEMSPTSENPVQNKVLYQVIDEMDFVLSAAVNDLNTNKANKSDAVMKTDIDDEMSRTSENPVQNKILKAELDRIDLVTAAALNALNSKIDNKTFDVDDELDDESENPVQNMVISKELSDITKATAAAMNDLNERKVDKSYADATYATADTVNEILENIDFDFDVDDHMDEESENPVQNKVVLEYITEIEHVAASSINDLNTRKADKTNVYAKTETYSKSEVDGLLSDMEIELDDVPTEDSENAISSGGVYQALYNNELVTAAALNELNDSKMDTTTANARFVDIEDALYEKANVSDLATDKSESLTWSALKSKRDGGNLVPGKWYRITDYQCTTTQTNTSAASHLFDIVVLALSNNTLSEEARAINHAGDTYFSTSKLNAWKLWYSLDNDTTRFAWADTTNGKGVIWRMIDEFNNDIKYDFKNILFQRKLTNGSYNTSGTNTWCYTLNLWYNNACNDASIVGNTLVNDEDDVVGVCNNIFGYATAENLNLGTASTLRFALGNNVILSYEEQGEYFGIFANVIGSGFYNNTFAGGADNNTIGSSFQNNTIGYAFYGNTIGNEFCDNELSNFCYQNMIGNSFKNNNIGTGFNYNVIGNGFSYNVVGDTFAANSIGNSFGDNAIGNGFVSNTIGNDVDNNTIGTGTGSTATTINFVRNICFEDGIQYVNLTTTATTSSSNYLQNIVISRGISGTSSTRKTITHPTVNDTFRTTYQPANSQVINV